MTCLDAEPYVSAVCDGEQIPSEAARHIGACAACRATLAEYTRMGTELRVAAALDSETLPQLELPQPKHGFDLLWRRVAVPRFALGALILAVIAAGAAVPLVRAQQRPLWFQFGYTFEPGGQTKHYRVAKAGFDETGASMALVNGSLVSAAVRIGVESIAADDVVLRCRAISGNMQVSSDSSGTKTTLEPPGDVPFNHTSVIHYKPGQQLAIPIEGGGTIYFRGDVYEQQPKIAFGAPLEPASNEIVMRGSVLTSNGEVISDLPGGGASGTAVTITAGKHGTFEFALSPFAGAVQGQMEWGQMTFMANGRSFHLVAAAPLAGGEQPRPVWVRYDPTPVEGTSIGAVRHGQ